MATEAEITQEQKFKFRARAEQEAAAAAEEAAAADKAAAYQDPAVKAKPGVQNADEMAVTLFGPGVSNDISPIGRIKRIGEMGVLGMGIGGTIGAGVGALAGGVGAVPGAFFGATLGGIGGVVSEVAGQASQAMGAGRAVQVMNELVAGGIAQSTATLLGNAPKILGMIAGRFFPGTTRTLQAVNAVVTDKGAVPASKQVTEALGGFKPSDTAPAKVGGAIQSAATAEGEAAKKAAMAAEQADTLVAKQKAQAATLKLQKEADLKTKLSNARISLEAKTKQQKAEQAASKDSTIAEMRATSMQQESAAREKAVRAKEGLNEPPPTEELGFKIQNDVMETANPLYKDRSANYDKAYTAAVQSASTKEAAGQHFAKTESFAQVDKYWRDQIKAGKMTEKQSTEIESILNEIKYGRGNKPVKDEWGEVVGRTPPEPKTLEGVDSYVRQLGDKAFMEAEGGKAIGVQKAKELRKTLLYGVDGEPDAVKGGLYAWEPKLQEAKALYAQDSEGLKAYRTSQGKDVTAFEQDVRDRPKVAAIDVPAKYFKSAQGVKDLTAQLGGDAVKSGEYATQHAMKQLEGKDAKAAAKWIGDKSQDWMDAVPGLRDKLGKYQASLAQTESGAVSTKAAITAADKAVEKAATPIKPSLAENKPVKPVKPDPVQNWSTRVDETTRARLGIAGVNDPVTPKNARQVFSDILASKQSDAQLRAIGHYIKQSPEATAAVADAVRDHMSGKTGRSTVETWNSQVLPALEGSGIVPKEDMAALKRDVAKLHEAVLADKGLDNPTKKRMLIEKTRDILLRFLIQAPTAGRQEYEKNQ